LFLNAKCAKIFFEIIENIFKVRKGVKLSKDFEKNIKKEMIILILLKSI